MKKTKPINEKVINTFSEFFDEYYRNNREVKNISYRTMRNNEGYSAILTYKNFRQYVNFYKDQYGVNSVNSCFELELDGNRFLCHFVDILNVLDSDDISFYTYFRCMTDEKIIAAFKEIMAATEKYFVSIDMIALSHGNKQKAWASMYDDLEFEDFEYDEDISLPENVDDLHYFLYCGSTDIATLKKELAKKERRGKLEPGFETRAARVLALVDKKDAQKLGREQKRHQNLSAKEVAVLMTPYAIGIVLMGTLGYFLGLAADKALYAGLIGRDHG